MLGGGGVTADGMMPLPPVSVVVNTSKRKGDESIDGIGVERRGTRVETQCNQSIDSSTWIDRVGLDDRTGADTHVLLKR